MALLEVRQLDKWFGGLHAIDNVSFRLDACRILGIIGPNGAGKTTLFNVITGMMQPTKGKVILDEIDITGSKAWQMSYKGVMRTFQNLKLFENMRVIDNVRLGMHSRMKAGVFTSVVKPRFVRREEKDSIERALKLLDSVGLFQKQSDFVHQLPYGDRKRLEIARALAGRPRLLLLDEPAAGLVSSDSEELSKLIKQLNRTGLTIMFIEHRMKFLMGLAHHILVLDHGSMIAEGEPSAIQRDPRVVEAYLGKDGI